MQKRLSNDIAGLKFIHAFGWLRAAELGALLFPKTATATIAAARVIRSWEQRRFVIVRDLPERAGRAVVLAAAGVRFLSENGYEASTGKDLGSTTAKNWKPPASKLPDMAAAGVQIEPEIDDDGRAVVIVDGVRFRSEKQVGVWKPPASWRHDLIAAGVLVELRKWGYEVIPEATIRRLPNDSTKIPDGLLRSPDGDWIWLEVEHARKSGMNMQLLGKAIALAASGEIKKVAGNHCTKAMIAYSESKDERGYSINHRSRVLKAVSEQIQKPLEVSLVRCELLGAGVSSIELEKTLIAPHRALAVLRVLESGLQKRENGVLHASYGGHKVTIWEEKGRWVYRVNQSYATYCTTISDAKEQAAQEIADLL